MLTKLLALTGFSWARRWNAQAARERLETLLDYLEGADSPIEEGDWAFIESFFPAHLQSEYRKAHRALRRKFAIRGCKQGIIRCAEEMGEVQDAKLLAWREEERQGKRKTTNPANEPLEFTPGRHWGKNEADTDYITDPE